VRCPDATAISFVAKVQGEVFANFQAVKTLQYYAELIVWPARTNSLWTVLLMSQKMTRMLVNLLLTCRAFFGLGEFGLSVKGSSFLPRKPV
jgi:hypothetical protein